MEFPSKEPTETDQEYQVNYPLKTFPIMESSETNSSMAKVILSKIKNLLIKVNSHKVNLTGKVVSFLRAVANTKEGLKTDYMKAMENSTGLTEISIEESIKQGGGMALEYFTLEQSLMKEIGRMM